MTMFNVKAYDANLNQIILSFDLLSTTIDPEYQPWIQTSGGRFTPMRQYVHELQNFVVAPPPTPMPNQFMAVSFSIELYFTQVQPGQWVVKYVAGGVIFPV